MDSLKRHKRDSRAYRDYQKFMVDVLNLMARAYAVELHDTYGFGAARLSELTDNAIKSVHAAIARYDGEFAETALEVQCKRFNFDPRIGLNGEGAVEFKGGIIGKTERRNKMRTTEEIKAEIGKVEKARRAAVQKQERCEARLMELACEHTEALNEENRRKRSGTEG